MTIYPNPLFSGPIKYLVTLVFEQVVNMSKWQFRITSPDELRTGMRDVNNLAHQLVHQERLGIRVTIQTISLRTLAQNRLMWARLEDISKQVDWYGRKLTPDEWKDVLTASLYGYDVVPNIHSTGFVVLGLHTHELSVKEMTAVTELAEAFGVLHDVTFKEPTHGEAA